MRRISSKIQAMMTKATNVRSQQSWSKSVRIRSRMRTCSAASSAGKGSKSSPSRQLFRVISRSRTPIAQRSRNARNLATAFRSLASIFSLIKWLSRGSLKLISRLVFKLIVHLTRKSSKVYWLMLLKYSIFRLNVKQNTWTRYDLSTIIVLQVWSDLHLRNVSKPGWRT